MRADIWHVKYVAHWRFKLLCQSSSTDDDSTDNTSGQFLFYYKKEATQSDKSSDDHGEEPPCRNVVGWQTHCDDEGIHRNSIRKIDQSNVTSATSVSINDVTKAEHLTFKIILWVTVNKQYNFDLLKATRRFSNNRAVVFLNSKYHLTELTPVRTGFYLKPVMASSHCRCLCPSIRHQVCPRDNS